MREQRTKRFEEEIRALAIGDPATALADLTAVAHRAVVELNKLARDEAARRRGTADWGKWARLANATRSGVLQVAAMRDSVKAIAPRIDAPVSTEPRAEGNTAPSENES